MAWHMCEGCGYTASVIHIVRGTKLCWDCSFAIPEDYLARLF